MKHDIHSFNTYLSSAYCVLAGRRWTRLEHREGSHWKNSKKGGKRIRRECFYCEGSFKEGRVDFFSIILNAA